MTLVSGREQTPADWLGYFYGHDLSFLHAETLAIQNINPTLLKKEAELMGSKWFDYRKMHPTKATYYLASEYNKAYGNAICVMKDGERGKYMKGFKGLDFMSTKEKLSFWRLRQKIDQLGIRYDFYLRFVMNHCIEQGWRQPPRPAMMGSNDEVVLEALVAWEEECRNRIQFSKDPRYKVANFFGHSDQVAYEKFIIQQIQSRRHPHFSLKAAMYDEDAVRIEQAILHFDEDIILRATS